MRIKILQALLLLTTLLTTLTTAQAHYHPGEGRWLSRDPIGGQGGTNIYGFVNNAPTNHWDLLGHKPGDEFNTPQEAIDDARGYLREKGIESVKAGRKQYEKFSPAGFVNGFPLILEEGQGPDFVAFRGKIERTENGRMFGNRVVFESWIGIFGKERASYVYCFENGKGQHKFSYNYDQGVMLPKEEFLKRAINGKSPKGYVPAEIREKLSKVGATYNGNVAKSFHTFLHTHLIHQYEETFAGRLKKSSFQGLSFADPNWLNSTLQGKFPNEGKVQDIYAIEWDNDYKRDPHQGLSTRSKGKKLPPIHHYRK